MANFSEFYKKTEAASSKWLAATEKIGNFEAKLNMTKLFNHGALAASCQVTWEKFATPWNSYPV